MAWYRMYLVDSAGRIESARNLEGDTDAAAVAAARRIFGDAGAPAFELWQGNRLVHKEARASAE